MMAMEWKKLLSSRRLGKRGAEEVTLGRSPFQQDFDRVTFSSAFRRLQDKAQVFPLPSSDYVRTRLTHSLEAASIGRSLGGIAGVFICRNFEVGGIQPSDIGAIVAAACLAHDIGNPPLGHCGEDAIQHWFTHSDIALEAAWRMDEAERRDIEHYEGNAQGFRVLARLEAPENYGGLQLTCATLGTFAKYPVSASSPFRPNGVAGRKFNFFREDRELFAEVAQVTGLIPVAGVEQEAWCRHPLAFLVEAADDVTYRIVDFEDAHALQIIEYAEVERLFLDIIGEKRFADDHLGGVKSAGRRVEIMRAKALGKLVYQAVRAFEKHHDAILAGELERPLIELIPAAGALEEIYRRSLADIYTNYRAAEVGAAGFELAAGLLDAFLVVVNELAAEAAGGAKATARSRKFVQLLPPAARPVDDPEWRASHYHRLLLLLDWLASLTDSHAVSIFKKIRGISLPGAYL